MVGRVEDNSREGDPGTAPADHPEVQIIQLRQILGALQLFSVAFVLFCAAVFFYTGNLAVGLSGTIIFAFSVVATAAKRQVGQGNRQRAVVLVCAAIICSSLALVPLQPALLPTSAVTSLVAAVLAIPYARERPFKMLMIASWVSVVIVVGAGPVLAARSSGEEISPFEFVFGASTLIAAAAIVLLLLWQFRVRLMAALQQTRLAEGQARHDATHDSLTGLPNRTLLEETLSRHHSEAMDNPVATFAMLYLDLDRFKHVNDSLGHHLGDELLEIVAQRLLACVRPESDDMVARPGGDEFVLVLSTAGTVDRAGEISRGVADIVVERIQEAFRRPIVLHGHELYTTPSIGILPDCSGYESVEEILRDADTAMFRSKEAGEGRPAIFEPSMRVRPVSMLRMETDFRRAVERREFSLHYQPIVWLATGGVVGFEAVAWWDHPERGLLPPEEFAPLAHRSGLIQDLDLLALGEVCRQGALWRRRFPDHFPPRVSIKLSAGTFLRQSLPEEIASILKESGLPAHALMIEVSEKTVVEEPELAMQVLERLKVLGVLLVVGDFGTGRSSLDLLHRMPIDTLKIDRSFVRDIRLGDEDPAEIARTVLTVAHELGLEVLAEGLDTSEQLQVLSEMECDYAQGTHFSHPVDTKGAEAILAAEPSW